MKLIIILLLWLHLLSFVIFDRITREDGAERIPYNIVLNTLAFFVLFSLFCSDGDAAGKLQRLLHMEGSYRDAARLSLFLIAHIALSWALARLYHRLSHPGIKLHACMRLVVPAVVIALVVSVFGLVFAAFGIRNLTITEVVAGENGSVTLQNNGTLSIEATDLSVCGVSLPEEIRPGEALNVPLDVPCHDGRIDLSRFGKTFEKIELPEMKCNALYTRSGDSWTLTSSDIRPEPPVLSAPSGFYDETFELSLSAGQGCRIYYTLDGTVPNINANLYTAPIAIHDRSDEPDIFLNYCNVTSDYIRKEFAYSISPKATVVRAVAVDEDERMSEPITATYFPGIRESRPILSLVMDPNDLFGDNGIYVTGSAYDQWYLSTFQRKNNTNEAPSPNFMREGEEWVRPASLELFTDGEATWKADVSAGIYGISTREYARKEFRLCGSDGDFLLQYGTDSFIAKYLAQGRAVTATDFRQAVLYLNGEPWEDIYLCRDLDKTNLGGVTVNNGVSDTPDAQQEYDCLSKLADDYGAFSECVDIQSYIDESCLRVFLADIDHSENWRSFVWKPDGGKWTWGLYDLNFGWDLLREEFSVENPWEIDPFTMYGEYQTSPVRAWPIFQKLCEKEDFVRRYALTMMDLVNTNLSAAHTLEALKSLDVEEPTYKAFFEHRAPYVISYTAQALGLSGETGTIELLSQKGTGSVRMNTVEPAFENGRFVGTYYTEYPVELNAQGDGFRLWRVTRNGEKTEQTERQIFVTVDGGVTVEAVFE